MMRGSILELFSLKAGSLGSHFLKFSLMEGLLLIVCPM